MKVIKKNVWIGERENEGMKRFRSFSPNICSHLWSELFRATEKMRNRPCLSQLTINQLHVLMMRGLGVWRSFNTAPNAVHEH